MKVFDDKGVLMIKMSPEEALQTIRSLAEQLNTGSCNGGRLETFLKDDGRDFSIAVVKPKVVKPKKG